MSDKSAEPQQAMAEMRAHMAPLQAVLSDAIQTTADFGRLALKTCLTINGGALLAYPTVLKIFTPTGAPLPNKGLVAVEHLFAIGTACAAVGVVLAWMSAAWGSFVLGQIMVLPILQIQKSAFPQSLHAPQEKRLRRAEWSAKWGQRLTWGAIGLTAFIVLAGYIVAIWGGVDGAHLVAALGGRH
jgi:hypothetical protein